MGIISELNVMVIKNISMLAIWIKMEYLGIFGQWLYTVFIYRKVGERENVVMKGM